MLGKVWNHNLIRKYTIMFGSLFTEIYINREEGDNQSVQTIQVPISYGPRDMFLARIDGDPNLSRPAIVLPRIGFQMNGLTYAPDRKLNSLNRSVAMNANKNSYSFAYSPVPYDFSFDLYVVAKSIDDGNQIIEQILPMFTPDWTINATLVPELGIVHDIPIVLNTTAPTDSYDQAFTQRRAIVWTLNFTLKGYLYGPTREGALIKKVFVNFRDSASNNVYETYTVQPGLTANGQPTSNATLSIDINDIAANSNYGFIEDLF